MNRVGIADFPVLRTLLVSYQNSGGPSFWEVIDSFVLLGYASLAASRTIIVCLNFTVDSEDLFCRYKWKSDFLNHEDEWGLTWYLQLGIYTSILTRTPSHNSLTTAEAPHYPRYPPMEHLSNENSLKWEKLCDTSHCEFVGKLMETGTTTWSEFPKGGRATVEQIVASEEINKSKRTGEWES